jgi:hypothetical protein
MTLSAATTEALRPFLEEPANSKPSDLEARLADLRASLLAGDKTLAELSADAALIGQANTLVVHGASTDAPLVAAALALVLLPGTTRESAAGTLEEVARHLGVAVSTGLDVGQLRVTRRAPRRRLRAVLAFLVGVLAMPAAFYFRERNPTWTVGGETDAVAASGSATRGEQLRDGYSNIRHADYVGPKACAECHATKHEEWRGHPHSRMNQDATPESVQGDFSGARVHYGAIEAAFDRDGDGYRMTLFEDSEVLRRYRVTRTVGSRFTQMYIGVQTEGPEPASDRVYSTEAKLPFGFWTARERWLPVNYFDSDFTPDYDDDGSNSHTVTKLTALHRWEASCLYCHNTYPYTDRLSTARSMTTGFPTGDLHLERPAEAAAPEPQRTLGPDRLITLGISCESCHFGGREHVEAADRDESVPPRFLPSAPDLIFGHATQALVEDARASPYVVNSICAQCHSARISLYPDGSGTWNSREAIDLVGGACAEQIKCTDCHDPHQAGPRDGGEDTAVPIKACLSCHETYQDAAASAAHSRHSGSVTCLDCHMPRVVQGLDRVIRTHQIGSPTDLRMLSQGAPNACNLCHLDRSIRWTANALREWGASVEPQPEWAEHYGGDLANPVGEAWLNHDVPVARLVATSAYSNSALGNAALPRLVDALMDRNPVNRMFALFALERVIGRSLTADEYEPTLPPAERAVQVAALRRSLH